MITGRQIRAARGLLDWDATELASKAGLTRETVSKIENETVQARETTLQDILQVFDQHGLEFIDNQGVRFKPSGVDIYDGVNRFNEFYDFLYDHLKYHGGDICLSIYDETLLAKYRRDPEVHRNRMKDLVNRGLLTFRILATKSDFVSHNYVQFRWQSQHPTPTGFYAFGDCLALMSFVNEESPHVVVVRSAPLAEAYRQSFDIAWQNAKEKPLKGEKI